MNMWPLELNRNLNNWKVAQNKKILRVNTMGPSKKNFFSELGSEATYLSLSVNSSYIGLKILHPYTFYFRVNDFNVSGLWCLYSGHIVTWCKYRKRHFNKGFCKHAFCYVFFFCIRPANAVRLISYSLQCQLKWKAPYTHNGYGTIVLLWHQIKKKERKTEGNSNSCCSAFGSNDASYILNFNHFTSYVKGQKIAFSK